MVHNVIADGIVIVGESQEEFDNELDEQKFSLK